MTIRKLTSALVLTLSFLISQAQQDQYRTRTAVTGNWNGTSTWQKDNAGDNNFSDVSTSPTNADGNIIIRSDANITVTAGVTVDQVTVNGVLNISSGNTLTCNSGTDAIIVASGGTLNVQSGGTLAIGSASGSRNVDIQSGGTLTNSGTINQGGTFRILRISGTYNSEEGCSNSGAGSGENLFQSGSTYNINNTTTAGFFPANSTWNSASTAVIRGYTSNTSMPSNSTQTFGNITWNTASLNHSDFAFTTNITCAGNFRVLNTNGNQIYFANGALGANRTFTITGTFEVSGGALVGLAKTTTSGGNVLITCADFTFANDNSYIDFNESSSALDNSITLTGNYSASNIATMEITGGGTASIIFNGGTQSYSQTNAVSIGAVNYTINASTTLNMGTSQITGSGAFTLNGILGAGSTNSTGAVLNSGTLGNIASNGTRTWASGCRVVYNGTSAQFVGFNNSNMNMEINNSNGVSIASGTDLTISSGRTLIFTSGRLAINGRTLTIAGDVTGMSASNSFTGSSSSNITVSGTGTLSSSLFFDQTSSSTSTINNFTRSSSGSLTIGNAMNLEGVLTVSNGTFNSGGNVTLVSTSSKTAQIASIGGTISGNFTAQRFIPSIATTNSTDRARKLWRFIASPVGGVSFQSSWQNQTHITGSGGAGNNFDATTSNSSSLMTYDETTSGASSNGWTGLGNTSSNLTRGTGYRMFVRGNRTASNLTVSSSSAFTSQAITLSATGSIATDNTAVSVTCSNGCVSGTDGWNLIGNPHAATIDWESVTRSSVNSTYYVWNPGVQAYASYTIGGSSSNGGSRFISSGQALFVECSSAGGGTVTFNQSAKSTSNSNDLFKTSIVPNNLSVILFDPVKNFSNETVVGLRKNATRNFDGEYDAWGMLNDFGYISSNTQDGKLLAVNMYPELMNGSSETIVLNTPVNPDAYQSYTLKFNGVNSFSNTNGIYLRDIYLNTMIDIRVNFSYNYTITSDPASSAANRFEIIFSSFMQQLPVSFAGFNAEKMNQSTLLKWNTASEQNNALFEIERSIDGISYQKIGVVKGSGNSSKLVSYTYTDELPQMNDRNYYRLKQLDYDGKYSYSSIEVVDFTNSGTIKDAKSNEFLFNVYPVPSSNVITIDLANTYTGNVNIRIFDNVGKLVETHPATIAKAYSSIEENISHLKAGMYLIEVVSDGGAYKGQAKFIKE